MSRKQRTMAILAVMATRKHRQGSADITEITSHPWKPWHRHYYLDREVLYWLQFSITESIFCGFITLLNTWHLHVERYVSFLILHQMANEKSVTREDVSGGSWVFYIYYLVMCRRYYWWEVSGIFGDGHVGEIMAMHQWYNWRCVRVIGTYRWYYWWCVGGIVWRDNTISYCWHFWYSPIILICFVDIFQWYNRRDIIVIV